MKTKTCALPSPQLHLGGKELKNHFQAILIFYLRWFICLRIKHSFNNSLTKFLSQLS